MPDIQEFFTNFLQSIGGLLPGVLGALAVLIIGWFLAKAFSGLTGRMLRKTDLDNRLFRGAKSSMSPEKFFSKMVYYIIMLMVLMVVLEMLGVNNVLDPIKDMVGKFMGAIPNIVQAGIIGFAGYIIATIASEVLGFAGGRADEWSEKMGLANSIDLAKVVKQLVFLVIFIPILIQAIDALGMTALSEPLTGMLHSLVGAIPKILVAAIIIGVFYVGGKFVTSIVADLMRNLGVDSMTSKLGLTSMIGQGKSLSSMVAGIGFFFLMFTGVIQAADKLDMGQLSEILNRLLGMSGNIFFGLVIMAVGNFISNIASRAVNDEFLSTITRIATLGLFIPIALHTMGIGTEIVNLAFGLILGAIAVAVALSFGLGGREAAGKQMEHILKRFRNDK